MVSVNNIDPQNIVDQRKKRKSDDHSGHRFLEFKMFQVDEKQFLHEQVVH
jgi:hypothetical protein